MLRTLKSILNNQIEANDGKIGKTVDIYFDDQNWAIRYIVGDIGTLLLPRSFLLSPAAVTRVDKYAIRVNQLVEQIKKSPTIDTAKPITREQETQLHDHFSWTYYWVYPSQYNSLGGALYPGLVHPTALEKGESEPVISEALEKERSESAFSGSHVRSAKELTGYTVLATDEQIGSVSDLILDDSSWVIRYLIVDTRIMMHGKHTLLSPNWIKGIDWEDSEAYVDISKDLIKNGPEYDPSEPISRDFESRLFDYFRKQKYWD